MAAAPGTWSRSVAPGALLASDSVGATIRAMDTLDTHVRHLPEGAAVIFPACTEEAATVVARIGGYGSGAAVATLLALVSLRWPGPAAPSWQLSGRRGFLGRPHAV